jgi:mono/diheme cytochrome c family protein
MPPWGPQLGDRKIIEVISYVLSHHEPPPAGEAQPTPPASPAGPP